MNTKPLYVISVQKLWFGMFSVARHCNQVKQTCFYLNPVNTETIKRLESMVIIRTTYFDVSEPWILHTQFIYKFHITHNTRRFSSQTSINRHVLIKHPDSVFFQVQTEQYVFDLVENSSFCPHSVFMCFVWIWEQTAIISLHIINWLIFITETECVYCAVRSAHTMYLCVLCGSENKQRLFHCKALTDWFL
jgi:hypothetical protein